MIISGSDAGYLLLMREYVIRAFISTESDKEGMRRIFIKTNEKKYCRGRGEVVYSNVPQGKRGQDIKSIRDLLEKRC